MKFGYDADGNLVPSELLELQAKVAVLEAKVANRSLRERAEDVLRLRAALTDTKQLLSPEDEKVLALYQEGVIDIHNIEYHFGERLFVALQRLDPRNGDAA